MKTVLAFIFSALLSFGASAADAVPKTKNPMKIGIIGTGDIGGALARHWGAAGHDLMISSRHPEQLRGLAKEIGPNVKVGTPKEAAAFGAVIMLAVPYGALPQVGRDYASELEGKVVMDAGNPYPSRDGEMAVRDRARGTGVAVAEYLPGVRLVRAREFDYGTPVYVRGYTAAELRKELKLP
jgi:predicted dinucleotide-binding enzyme